MRLKVDTVYSAMRPGACFVNASAGSATIAAQAPAEVGAIGHFIHLPVWTHAFAAPGASVPRSLLNTVVLFPSRLESPSWLVLRCSHK